MTAVMDRYPAPYSTGGEPPEFQVPANACDCHMHLFDTSVPFAPGPVLKHGDATLEDYQVLQRRLRLRRHVIVQPSSYGTNNSVLIRGLNGSAGSARGVAVVDRSIKASDIERLHSSGVRGVRFNLVQAGATDETMLEEVAAIIEPFGWHIQAHLPPSALIRLHTRLLRLPVQVVLDHFARVNVERSLSQELTRVVVRMLRSGRTWLKLSGAYMVSPEGDAFESLNDFVRQCIAARPDRLLWGTDWPHVTEPIKPDDAVLMNLLARWFTADQIHLILVKNPEILYSF